MTKFQIGDTVRLTEQGRYGSTWDGDITIVNPDNGWTYSVDALAADGKNEGAFSEDELELVYREDNEAPTGGVILWLAVALLIWAGIVAYIGYQAVMS